MKTLINRLKKFLESNCGAVTAEYAVLLFIVATALILGLGAMTGAIHNVVNNTTTNLGGTPQ